MDRGGRGGRRAFARWAPSRSLPVKIDYSLAHQHFKERKADVCSRYVGTSDTGLLAPRRLQERWGWLCLPAPPPAPPTSTALSHPKKTATAERRRQGRPSTTQRTLLALGYAAHTTHANKVEHRQTTTHNHNHNHNPPSIGRSSSTSHRPRVPVVELQPGLVVVRVLSSENKCLPMVTCRVVSARVVSWHVDKHRGHRREREEGRRNTTRVTI